MSRLTPDQEATWSPFVLELRRYAMRFGVRVVFSHSPFDESVRIMFVARDGTRKVVEARRVEVALMEGPESLARFFDGLFEMAKQMGPTQWAAAQPLASAGRWRLFPASQRTVR